MPSGLSWRFVATLYSGTLLLDDYSEHRGPTIYIGYDDTAGGTRPQHIGQKTAVCVWNTLICTVWQDWRYSAEDDLARVGQDVGGAGFSQQFTSYDSAGRVQTQILDNPGETLTHSYDMEAGTNNGARVYWHL